MKKNRKTRVGVHGAGGRMGREIAAILAAHDDLEPFLGVDHAGHVAGFTHQGESLRDRRSSEVDLWIDFSLPDGFDSILAHCLKKGTPLVSGTTGLSSSQKKKLSTAGKKIPVLWSSNMSLGVAVLSEALRVFSRLDGFDFQIEEIHHRRKKDRPSGTALSLQEVLIDSVGRDIPEPLALRGGGVFGVHKVWAFSEEEVLMFEHQALNRAVFARGAVAAAAWLRKKGPGSYTVREMLFGASR